MYPASGRALITVLLCLTSVAASPCPWSRTDLTKWSAWSGQPDSNNQTVDIPQGTAILLDVSPKLIYILNIEGELIFDNVNLTLDAYAIFVNGGGHLWIGSPSCNYTANAAITLHGQRTDENVSPEMGHKFLAAASGGQIDIFGVIRGPTWTFINASIDNGATSFRTSEPTSWQVGDKVVVTTTDYGAIQNEQRTIVQVLNATAFEVDSPFTYSHWGTIWHAGNGDYVDMRGEVALLTRNIIIQGDVQSEGDGWGGQCMCFGSCQMRVQGAWLLRMGQKDLKARYPLHWHMAGSQPNSYGIGNTVQNSYSRCYTVHGTSDMLLRDNVAFNVSGHCYFIEDGWEVNNTLLHNIGILASTYDLLVSDANPSMFWLTNANNQVINNCAVSCVFGFWYASPVHPLGLFDSTLDYSTWPMNTPVAVNRGNRAHSTYAESTGLREAGAGMFAEFGANDDKGNMFDYQDGPSGGSMMPRNMSRILKYINANTNLQPVYDLFAYSLQRQYNFISEFTAFKNGGFGLWWRGDSTVAYNCRFADNKIAISLPVLGSIQYNTVIVGDTDNVGDISAHQGGRSRFDTNWPALSIVGHQQYDSNGIDYLVNAHFYNFNDDASIKDGGGNPRPSAAFGWVGGLISPSYDSKFYNNTFKNVQRLFSFHNVDAPYNTPSATAVMYDVDGTMTGTCGNRITSDYNPTLHTESCVHDADKWQWTCSPPYLPMFAWNVNDGTGNTNTNALDNNDRMQVTMLYNGMSVATNADQTPNSWPVKNLAFMDYGVQFGGNDFAAASSMYFSTSEQRNLWIRVAVPYPGGTTFTIGDSAGHTLQQVDSLDQVVFNGLKYFWDGQLLWFIVQNWNPEYYFQTHSQNAKGNWGPGNWLNVAANCPNSNCQVAGYTFGVHAGLPTPDKTPASWLVNNCELGGPIPLFGKASYTPVPDTTDMYVYNNGSLQNGFFFANDNYQVDSTDPVSSVINGQVVHASTKFNKGQGRLLIQYCQQCTFNASGYTHVELQIMTYPPGQGPIDLELAFDSGHIPQPSANGGGLVVLNGPQNCDRYGPVDDSGWTTVRLPLASFYNVGAIRDLWRLKLQSSGAAQWADQYDYVLLNYVKFTTLSTAVHPDPTWGPPKMPADTGAKYAPYAYATPGSGTGSDNSTGMEALSHSLPTYQINLAVLLLLAALCL